MAELSPQEKIALIKENLQEVLREDILEDVIVKQNRPLVIYLGTATTGRPHVGYFVPLLKLSHFLRAGCRVKVLLADIHGFLDNLKAPIDLVNYRATYYKFVITSVLKAIGVDISKLEFVLGSTYQLSSKYSMDLLRLSTVVTEHDAKKAGAEVVKQVDNATLSGLIYPLMQALDEEYLEVDAQFGGVDQRKIFTFAQESLPKIGYKERAHLMNKMVPGLAGGKMSASDPDSKIDLLDSADVVKKKLKKAYAKAMEVEGNGLISFIEFVLLPLSGLQAHDRQGRFIVKRRPEEGEELVYTNIEQLKEDYLADKLTPQLLKASVSDAIISILEPVQAEFRASQEWQSIEKLAYPPPPEPAKKKKTPKDKGSRYPGSGPGASAGVANGPEKAKDAPGAQGKEQVVSHEDGSADAPQKVQVGGDVVEAMDKLGMDKKAGEN